MNYKQIVLIITICLGLCACTNPVSKDSLDAQIPQEGTQSSNGLSGQPLLPENSDSGDTNPSGD